MAGKPMGFACTLQRNSDAKVWETQRKQSPESDSFMFGHSLKGNAKGKLPEAGNFDIWVFPKGKYKGKQLEADFLHFCIA